MPESKAACPKTMAARPSQRLHARNRGRGFIPQNKGSADSCLGIGRHLHDQYLSPGGIVVYNSACPQAPPRLRTGAVILRDARDRPRQSAQWTAAVLWSLKVCQFFETESWQSWRVPAACCPLERQIPVWASWGNCGLQQCLPPGAD